MRVYTMTIFLISLLATVGIFAQTENAPTESTSTVSAPPADLNKQGLDAYKKDDFVSAITFFKEVQRLDPDNKTVRGNLVNSYQSRADQLEKAGKLKEAMELLVTAMAIEPENVLPINQFGAYYLREKKVDKAIDILEKAIKVAPGNSETHYLLGEAYYQAKDISAALAQWDFVLKKEPGRTELQERYEKARREKADVLPKE